MTYQELREMVRIQGGQVTVSPSLSPAIRDLLTTSYDTQALTIRRAQPGPGDNVNEILVIAGYSDFLNMSELPLVATFSLDEQGGLRALFEYMLLDGAPGPNDWTFSKSFPKLPVSTSHAVMA